MKLSTSVRRTREATKSLKIGTSGLEIEAKCNRLNSVHYY